MRLEKGETAIRVVMVCVFAMSVAASGCLAGDRTEDIEGPSAAVNLAQPSRFEEAFHLQIRPETEVITIGGASMNCVFFFYEDGVDYKILNGTATLTWAAGPLTPQFRIRIGGVTEPVSSGPSSSPVVLEFGRLKPGAIVGTPAITFSADYELEDQTVPIEQEATLALKFAYDGKLPEPQLGTCG